MNYIVYILFLCYFPKNLDFKYNSHELLVMQLEEERVTTVYVIVLSVLDCVIFGFGRCISLCNFTKSHYSQCGFGGM